MRARDGSSAGDARRLRQSRNDSARQMSNLFPAASANLNVSRSQTACKPGSVRPSKGSGRSFLWDASCDAPHATNPGDEAGEPPAATARAAPPVAPIRSCSRWGLPCRRRYRKRGALLPHRFTLTSSLSPGPEGGLFSVALSLRSPSPAVSRHRSPVEPGLSSTANATAIARPSGWRGTCAYGRTPSSLLKRLSASPAMDKRRAHGHDAGYVPSGAHPAACRCSDERR